MAKPNLSLFGKIIFWIFINLTVLPIILLVASSLFNHQIILHDLLSMQGHDRMRKAFGLIDQELSQSPESEWPAILKRFAKGYQVDLALMFADGTTYSSMEIEFNESIMKKVRYSIDQYQTLKREQSLGKKIPLLPEANPIHPDLLMQTGDPPLFWTGIVIEVPINASPHEIPAMLATVSSSISGNGFLFDPYPWIIIIGSVVVISIILWIPVVRHITQPVARMTEAAEEIAKGNFDVLLHNTRTDEIGRLATAINIMTERLSKFVNGQKRFMGDVAHELGSPIARIQFGLGALELRIDEKNRERVHEIMEDVNHMSALVHELLALSRIEIDTQTVRLEPCPLLPLVETAVRREFVSSEDIIIKVPDRISVTVCPELMIRAISNLLRNSLKYAGEDGPITVIATEESDSVILEIQDSGPGVKPQFHEQLFEPFFRIEPSRDRDSGGTGLGLAIVRTCVQNCKGEVNVRNLTPRGFCVSISLIKA